MKLGFARHFANPLSFVGGIVAVVGFGSSTVLLFIDLFSSLTNPYTGILTYAIFPAVTFAGLGISILGAVLRYRRGERGFPVLNLNDPGQRRATYFIFGFASVFLVLSSVGGYKAYEFTDDVAFCGELCHEVMEPEYTAYLNSPHARVGCVDCHVGPGAEWFVKAKLSGLYQVYATLANKFPRPIPTPIVNLRPAQETCEQCHWPDKFWGAQLTTKVHYAFDVTNTRREILLMVKTGGGASEHGPSEGIHWHMNIRNKVEYLPRDADRMEIPWVRVTYPDNTSRIYADTETPATPEELSQIPTRVMDCVDCHNRPSHTYLSPSESVDRVLGAGKADPRVPYLKTEATAVLAREYSSVPEALVGIEQGLVGAYQTKYPELARRFRREILAAIPELQSIYQKNFFPGMKANWAVYPTQISHKEFPGCFRCHDGKHEDEEGNVLSNDCTLCHTFVARAGEGGSFEEVPAVPTLYHPWMQAGSHGSMSCWNCHVGSESPYRTCGTCHEIDPEAPMAFACSTCHRPSGHEARSSVAFAAARDESRIAACTDCHATGGSKLHWISSHRNCEACHQPHGWTTSVPDDCNVCHGEMAKTHYTDQSCTACHDFTGVTSGFGSAPIPPAVRPPRAPEGSETATAPPDTAVPPEDEPASSGKSSANCIASGCHSELAERSVVHGPIASNTCGPCHRETSAEDHEFELTREEDELCVTCHVLRHDKLVVHKPFADSACLGCHDPHGGETKALLVEDSVEDTCLPCHSKESEGIVHAPVVEGQCSACHLSHQSDAKALLRAPETVVCTGCHKEVSEGIAAARSVHKPVAEGCDSCHEAHASPHPKLLAASYAPEFYSTFDEKAYALCLTCHSRQLFTEQQTSLTGFRNGRQNLHFVHLTQPGKGRTCRACHDSHASENPKLVRDSVPFGPGGWSLPVGFRANETGGTCATGCHVERPYDRVTPVSYGEE